LPCLVLNYFEYRNESNAPKGQNKNGFKAGATEEENAPYIFTNSELAAIAADMGYYATRGIKSVNKDVNVVFPGLYLTVPEDTRMHLVYI